MIKSFGKSKKKREEEIITFITSTKRRIDTSHANHSNEHIFFSLLSNTYWILLDCLKKPTTLWIKMMKFFEMWLILNAFKWAITGSTTAYEWSLNQAIIFFCQRLICSLCKYAAAAVDYKTLYAWKNEKKNKTMRQMNSSGMIMAKLHIPLTSSLQCKRKLQMTFSTSDFWLKNHVINGSWVMCTQRIKRAMRMWWPFFISSALKFLQLKTIKQLNVAFNFYFYDSIIDNIRYVRITFRIPIEFSGHKT